MTSHLLPTTDSIRVSNIDIYIYILYTYGDRHPPIEPGLRYEQVVGLPVTYYCRLQNFKTPPLTLVGTVVGTRAPTTGRMGVCVLF